MLLEAELDCGIYTGVCQVVLTGDGPGEARSAGAKFVSLGAPKIDTVSFSPCPCPVQRTSNKQNLEILNPLG